MRDYLGYSNRERPPCVNTASDYFGLAFSVPRKESSMASPPKALFGSYTTRLAVVGMLVLFGALVVASVAEAAVSISRAELNGTQVRSQAPASRNRAITLDGGAMGTSEGAGKFRIDRSGCTAPVDS